MMIYIIRICFLYKNNNNIDIRIGNITYYYYNNGVL